MTDRSEQIDSILSAAVELTDANDRLEYIQSACGGDDELVRQVTELVAAYFSAGDFLESPTTSFMPVSNPGVAESAGTQIGRYKLLQQIGEGGFAVVFMAEQEQPVRRQVAVKIIKPGMDSRQVIARFEAERQALAMMDHSNIAKVLDAGTTESGRPYFVMELVKGTPITDYSDQHRLSIDQRLELFRQVCDAVQHAHQKGVIHRDIKPSNVLVSTQDDRPLAKVIDFGIAKATAARLTDKTLFTDFRQLIGTPSYMSPEQAEGSLDIDTRSDVYSMGVLLYELLAGEPPFDPQEFRFKAVAEMQRIIREVDPPTPSTRLNTLAADSRTLKAAERQLDPKRFAERLRGELDWIVMRAIEKDRSRRYQSAAALADDIRRHLSNEPVEARPATPSYRFRKFARRNKGLLTALGAIGFILIAATVLSTWQAIRAARAEQTAIEKERQAREVIRTMIRLSVANRTSFRPRAAVQFAEAAREFTKNLPADKDEDAIRALIEVNVTNRLSGGAYSFDEVLETCRNKLGPEHPLTILAMDHVGFHAFLAGRDKEALEILHPLLEVRLKKLGPNHSDTQRSVSLLADLYGNSKLGEPAAILTEINKLAAIDRDNSSVQLARTKVLARTLPADEAAEEFAALIRNAKDDLYTDAPRKLLCRQLAELPDVFNAVARLMPDETSLWIGRGQYYVMLNQFDKAEADYSKVIHQRTLQDDHYEYGCLLLLRGDNAGYQKFCEETFERNGLPRHWYAAYVAARLYGLSTAPFAEPVQLTTWAELASHDRLSWQLPPLALAYIRAQRYSEAIDTYRESLPSSNSTSPDSGECWFGLSIANSYLNNDADARRCLEQGRLALKAAQPEGDGNYANVGIPSTWLLLNLMSREAESQAAKAADMPQTRPLEEIAEEYTFRIRNSDDGTAYWSPRKQVCREIAGDPKLFQAVAKLIPEEASLWIGRGQYLALKNQFSEAAADYSRVVDELPLQDEHFEYGCLLLLCGDNSAYQEFCRTVFEANKDSKDPYAAYVLSRLIALGPADCVSADRIVEWATIAARQKKPWELQVLGLSNLRAGRLPEAITAYEESLEAKQGNRNPGESHYGLAIAHHRLGKPSQAQQALQRGRQTLKLAQQTRGDGPSGIGSAPWLLLNCMAREAESVLESSVTVKSPKQAPANK